MSRRKKFLFAGITVALALLALEAISWVLLTQTPVGERRMVTWKNPDDPQGRLVSMPEEVSERMGESVAGNLEAAFLNRPDPRYIFRVREAVGEDAKLKKIGINSLGFRGPEFEFEPGLETRILLTGDSCMFGWGIWEFPKTIPGRLQELLDGRGRKARVFNLSQGGFSSYQCALMFEEWFEKIDPDIVILYLGWNDLMGSWITDRQVIDVLGATRAISLSWFRRWHLYKLLDRLISSGKYRLTGSVGEKGTFGRRVPVEDGIENIRSMVLRSREADCDVIVVLPPFSPLRSPERVLPPGEKPDFLGRWMVRLRADLVEAFDGMDRVTLLNLGLIDHTRPESAGFYQDDAFHPNEAGAEVISRSLEKVVTLVPGWEGKTRE